MLLLDYDRLRNYGHTNSDLYDIIYPLIHYKSIIHLIYFLLFFSFHWRYTPFLYHLICIPIHVYCIRFIVIGCRLWCLVFCWFAFSYFRNFYKSDLAFNIAILISNIVFTSLMVYCWLRYCTKTLVFLFILPIVVYQYSLLNY
jgi:hypothetical protein